MSGITFVGSFAVNDLSVSGDLEVNGDFEVNGTAVFNEGAIATANVELQNGATITGLPATPVNDADAASKAYVDEQIANVTPSPTNTALVATATDVGATAVGDDTLTFPGVAVDGVAVMVGDRILVAGQILENQNGLYAVTAMDDINGITVTRVPGATDAAGVVANNQILVQSGTYAGEYFYLQPPLPSVVSNNGGDPIVYANVPIPGGSQITELDLAAGATVPGGYSTYLLNNPTGGLVIVTPDASFLGAPVGTTARLTYADGTGTIAVDFGVGGFRDAGSPTGAYQYVVLSNAGWSTEIMRQTTTQWGWANTGATVTNGPLA